MFTKEDREQFEANRNVAVGAAMELFDQGDVEGARQKLFDAGISFDGISDYLAAWSTP